MGQPPQLHRDKSQKADRNARILQLAVAGLTERKIAATVGLSQPRVHGIITAELKARIDAPAEELIALREARLEDLYARAYAAMVNEARGSDAWAKAWDRCLKAEESLRRLKGADAPEALAISLERRSEEEAEHTVTAVEAAVSVLGLTASRRLLALEAAAAKLAGEPLPEPSEPEQAPDDGRVPWPFHTGGAQYVVVHGVRYIREGDHIPDDAEIVEEPLDGEVVEDEPETVDAEDGGENSMGSSQDPDDEPVDIVAQQQAGVWVSAPPRRGRSPYRRQIEGGRG